MKNKLEALRDMVTPEISEKLADVVRAANQYGEKRSDSAYSSLIVAVLSAALKGAIMFVPVQGLSADKKGMELSRFESHAGKGYVLCSSPEEAALCPEEIIIQAKSAAIVQTAVNEELCCGIYLNPYGKAPCLLQRDHMITILKLMQQGTKI